MFFTFVICYDYTLFHIFPFCFNCSLPVNCGELVACSCFSNLLIRSLNCTMNIICPSSRLSISANSLLIAIICFTQSTIPILCSFACLIISSSFIMSPSIVAWRLLGRVFLPGTRSLVAWSSGMRLMPKGGPHPALDP